jgi:chemotaxis protein MotA
MGGLLVAGMALFGGQVMEGGSLSSLVNLSALVIVLGGTVGATMLQVPLQVFRHAVGLGSWIFRPPASEYDLLVVKIVRWGELARRKGMLSLENELTGETDELIRKGLQLLVDGHEAPAIREALEFDLETRESFELRAAKVYESMGGYAPTIGILGAVMGLIHVMENLADPGRLGTGIASAFVATIYGVGFSNLVFLPFANKLKDIIRRRARDQEVIVEGIVAIAQGNNPRTIIESRLGGAS